MTGRQRNIVLLACSVLPACVTPGAIQGDLDTWRGRTAEELVAAWGAPQDLALSPRDNTLYQYIDTFVKPPNYAHNRLVLVCTVTFEVDRDGRIVAVGFEGDVGECRRTRAS
jgi:hypothetical protein